MSPRPKPGKTKSGKKRGRPRRAVKPPKADTTATVPRAQIDANDGVAVMRSIIADAVARLTKGKGIQAHHYSAAKLSFLTDLSQYVWATHEVAAAALNISLTTFRNFASEGCPGIEGHTPVIKHVVLAWLLANAHDRGGSPHATTKTAEDIETQIRLAKLLKVNEALIHEAEDRANQAVIRIASALRSALKGSIPAALYDAATASKSRPDAELAIEQVIAEQIARLLPGGRVLGQADAQAAPPAAAAPPVTATTNTTPEPIQ